MSKNLRTKSAATSRRRAASLKAYGEWCGEVVLKDYKLPVTREANPHPLPNLKKDLDAMMLMCRDNNQRALIALLGLEGMRLHEALELRLDRILIQDMIIEIWGKGNKERTIPITNLAWGYLAPRIIEQRLAGKQTLIEYSDRGARSFITELGVKANISRPVASHDLRATFATLAYAASGNNIRLVQAWLGHKDINTTQIYVGVKMDDMRQGGEF